MAILWYIFLQIWGALNPDLNRQTRLTLGVQTMLVQIIP